MDNKEYVKILYCKKCESYDMDTFRMPGGGIFCNKCRDEMVPFKEQYNIRILDGKYHLTLK
jgi:RNase P subunit RPR2